MTVAEREVAQQRETYQKAEVAWLMEKKKLDAQQQRDLEFRRATFKQVAVSANEAADAAKAASDKAAQGVKDNITLVEKQARIASSIAFPKMQEDYLDAIKQYQEVEHAYSEALKDADTDKMDRLINQENELLKQQQKQFGLTGSQLGQLRNEQLKDFGIREDLIKKMSFTEQKAYQGTMDRIFDRYMRERMEGMKTTKAINDMYNREEESLEKAKGLELKGLGAFDTKRIDIEKKYYLQIQDLEKKRASDQAKNDQMMNAAHNQAVVEKSKFDLMWEKSTAQLYEDLAKTQMSTSKEALDYMGALQGKFAKEIAEATSKVPGDMQDAVNQASRDLNAWYFEQLRTIQTTSYKSLEEQKTALDQLESQRAQQMKDFRALVENESALMESSQGAHLDAMQKSLSTFTDKLKKETDDAAKKSSAAVGTVQHELGVSAEDALSNLRDIAAIDPKKFANDLKVIKQVYIDFAKTAQEQAKNMLVVTNKAFDEFNKQAVDHWTKQKQNVSLMEFNEQDIKKLTEAIGKTVDRTFLSLTDMIVDRVQAAVTKGFTTAFAKVLVDTKKFSKDSLEIFRDFTQQLVRKFGDAWAKVLDFTASAVSAIEKDVQRSLANLRRVDSAMRGAANVQVQTAGTEVKQDVKMTTGKTELDNIFQATHHPEWYESDFKYKAQEIVLALNSLIAELAQAPRGGNTSGPPASRSAASNIRIGIGDNRAYGTLAGGIKK
jgi:hypothetical protein